MSLNKVAAKLLAISAALYAMQVPSYGATASVTPVFGYAQTGRPIQCTPGMCLSAPAYQRTPGCGTGDYLFEQNRGASISVQPAPTAPTQAVSPVKTTAPALTGTEFQGPQTKAPAVYQGVLNFQLR